MSRLIFAPLLLAFVLGGSALGLPADQDDLMEDIGIFNPLFFAELQDVELLGDRAYVFGVGGLAVIDITDPTEPLQLGRYEPPGHPYNRFYRGAVEGNLALGGGREDLLSVMQVNPDGNPWLIAVHGTPGQSFEGVELRNGIGYACRHGDGLEIIDFNQKTGFVSLSEVLTLVNSWDVDLQGDMAYVADGIGGLAVINIADPAAPVHLLSLPTSGSANDVVVDGNLAVVCCGSAGIDIFTLDNPASPVFAGNANTSGLAITAAIVGNTVYVAAWDDVESFNLDDPSDPLPVGGENTPIRAMGLAARDGLVVVADWSKLRNYSIGPSLNGDIDVSIDGIEFGNVEVGSFRDTTFTLGNTGGADISVSAIQTFSDSYTITTATQFFLPAGQSREVGVRFTHLEPGYAGTFLRISSNDMDESTITLPLSADDNPNSLNLGETAPEFTHLDMDGVSRSLSDGLGRVVVLAFFANW